MVLAMAEGGPRRAARLNWSVWRRTHQAVAARCDTARRAHRWDHPLPGSGATTSFPPAAALSDAEWDAVRLLLPPQRPPVGRPRHDHRTVLSGIVWVVRSQSSWRDLPREFGKWETAYKRYRLWRDHGLWTPISALLGMEGTLHSE